MRSLEKREEDVALAMLVINSLDNYPMSPRIIEIDVGLPWKSIRGIVERLHLTKLISKRRMRRDGFYGWYITATEKPSEEAVKEELDYLAIKKRWPIRYKEGDDIVRDKMTKRECRNCGEFLPQSRYFKCYECTPALELQDDDFLFHGVDSTIVTDFSLDDNWDNFFESDISEMAKTVPKEEDDE